MGIGGIGMSGIAHLLLSEGYTVSGCDADLNQKSCQHLTNHGALLYKNNKQSTCTDTHSDCIVYSTAISADHPELMQAQQRGIPTMHRAVMLAELMRKKYSIAISGSHGKTTTTGLIAHVLVKAELDPSIAIGGFLRTINANAHAGTGKFFVAEADESDRSFLKLPAAIAVVTNIDKEHLETYTDMTDITATFKQFITQLPAYGCAIMCIDNEPIRTLLPSLTQRIITYGFRDDAFIRGTNITITNAYSRCTVFRGIQELGTITIPIPGQHILQNTLAAVAVGLEIQIPFNMIASALTTFAGVERRFSYQGTFQGAAVYDDYGHHPNEIIPTVQMARQCMQGKLILVFQPHRYTRTQGLWSEFIDTLGTLPVNQIIITDLYSAGETAIPGIESTILVTEIKKKYPTTTLNYVPYTQDHSALHAALASKTNSGDLILLMGAGSINTVAKTLCNQN